MARMADPQIKRSSLVIDVRTHRAAHELCRDKRYCTQDLIEAGILLMCGMDEHSRQQTYLRLIEYRMDRRIAPRIVLPFAPGTGPASSAGEADLREFRESATEGPAAGTAGT